MADEESAYSQKKDVVFSTLKGNFFCFCMGIIWFILCWGLSVFIFGNYTMIIEGAKKTLFHVEFGLPVFIAGMIFQEVVKSLLLKFYANVPWNAQTAGFSISSFMPYVQSKYPIPVRKYILILLLPTFILLQIIWLAFIQNQGEWIILSTLWLFFSGYDILTALKLFKYKSFLAADHPDLPGAVIYENPF